MNTFTGEGGGINSDGTNTTTFTNNGMFTPS